MTQRNFYNDSEIYSLQSKRLKVDVLKPGNGYTRSRFDWTGFISRVVLDGKHTYCVPESLDPDKGCGGMGFCNEFGILSPVGYDETPPGGQFPKLGIGLLIRPDDQPYLFHRSYEIRPFDVNSAAEADHIKFKINPSECNGYAVELEKTVRLDENYMVIEYSLKNTGTKKVSTHEYCHNFIGIDGHLVGADYQLKFPYEVKSYEPHPILDIVDNTVSWKRQPEKDFYCLLKDFEARRGHSWELIHKPSKVGAGEYSDFTVSMIALWGSTHVISPEMFVEINVNPGETFKWTRKYEFFHFY